RVDVARTVDLRHDQNVARRGITNDALIVLLGEKSAGPAANLRQRSKLGETRPRIELNAPALIVRQVKVQHVQLVQRQQIDVLLDLAHSEEVTRDVQHRASPLEPRPASDGLSRQLLRITIHTDL